MRRLTRGLSIRRRAWHKDESGACSSEYPIIMLAAMALVIVGLFMTSAPGREAGVEYALEDLGGRVLSIVQGDPHVPAPTPQELSQAKERARLEARMLELADAAAFSPYAVGSSAWREQLEQVAKPYRLVVRAHQGSALYDGMFYVLGDPPRLLTITSWGAVLEYEDGNVFQRGKARRVKLSERQRWRFYLSGR